MQDLANDKKPSRRGPRLLGGRYMRTLRRNHVAVVSVYFLGAILLLAVLGPLLSPYSVEAMDFTARFSPPSLHHPFGTDRLGRDMFTRVLVGSQISLAVALTAVAMTSGIGITLGALSGFYGGKIDAIAVKISEIIQTMPMLLIVMTAATVIGPGLGVLIVMFGLLGWPGMFRITRAQYLSLKTRTFVGAAKAIGLSDRAIVFGQILPNAAGPITINATFQVASLVLLEAAVSFLGVGVQPPTPSLGNILSSARQLEIIENYPWMWGFAGFFITLTVLAINFVGDGLRDALDPHQVH
jgi:peptide/nickel transport system permease protein